MKSLRIFISSPGDVSEERQITGKVIERLQGKYWSFVRLDDVFWERRAIRATAHYQDELIQPGNCNLVVGLLWSRLGSPLPKKFARFADAAVPTGTEWELEEAFDAYEANRAKLENAGVDPKKAARDAKPDILIYRRKPAPDRATLDAARLSQLDQLEAYLQKNYFNDDGTIKRPILGYKDLGDFEKKLTTHLEELILRQIPEVSPGFEPPPISGSPFKGLLAFDFKDSDRYFGRNREIRELQHQLVASAGKGLPFMLIYGGSGFGKSSIMRAGLAPVLTRPGGSLDTISGWRRVPFQPAVGQGLLIERFVHALLQPPTPEEAEHSRMNDHWPLTGLSELRGKEIDGTTWDAAALVRILCDDEQRVFAITAILETLESLDRHLLLEIDQLEELFTAPTFDTDQRSIFLNTVCDLCLTGHVWTVATMRSEFFPRVAEQTELFDLVGKDRGYILPPPDRQSLREIIRYPALAARIDFEQRIKDYQIAGETAKHDHLHDQILADAESSPDALPLLEFTLQKLYDERRGDFLNWDSYADAGGLKGAIAKRATEIYEKLPVHAREASHRVFAALVHIDPAKGTITRLRAPLKPLKSHPGTKAFLNSFLDAHLLVTDDDGNINQPVVTLAHEALITHWEELASWIKNHQGDILARQRVAEQAGLWTEQGNKKSYLLSDARLAEAQYVAASDLFHLSEMEIRFVGDSRKRSSTKQRLLWAAIVLFALLAAGSTVLAKLAEDRRKVAINEKMKANAAESEAKNTLKKLNKNITFLEYDVRDALRNYAPLSVTEPILKHLKELSVENSNADYPDLVSQLNILSLEINQSLDKGLMPENSEDIIKRIQSITQEILEKDLNRDEIYVVCGNLTNIAQLYYHSNDRMRQLEFLESAHIFARKIVGTQLSPREVDLIFSLYKFYSVHYRATGDFTSALKYVEYAHQLIEKNDNTLNKVSKIEKQAEVWHEISCINLGNEKFEQALENCQKSYELSQQLVSQYPMNIQFNRDMAVACEQMALIFEKKVDYGNAAYFYQESARYYLNAGGIDRSRKNLFNLCIVASNSALLYLNFQPERDRLIKIQEMVKEATNNLEEYILIPQVRLNACIAFYSLAGVYSTLYNESKVEPGEIELALFFLRNSEVGLQVITNTTDKDFQEERQISRLIEQLTQLKERLSEVVK